MQSTSASLQNRKLSLIQMVFFSSNNFGSPCSSWPSLCFITAEHSPGFEIDVGYPKSDQIPCFTGNWKEVESADTWSMIKKKLWGFSISVDRWVQYFLSGFDKTHWIIFYTSLLQCTLRIMWIQHHTIFEERQYHWRLNLSSNKTL